MSAPPDITLSGTTRISTRTGMKTIFGPVDISVPAGEWTCLLGPSGAGKSTALRLIAGIEDTAILEGGITISDAVSLTGRTALMAQSDLLMPWLSVLENVMVGARLRGDSPDIPRARDVLSRVGLSGHADKTPEALSGGERQRVALARTLMENRPVVLLDEPFSALDARTRAEMQDLAAALLRGRTVLMVTHDPAEAIRLGHNVLLLTSRGIETIPVPDAPPPRAVDNPEALTAQGALLSRLMAGT